MKTRGLLILVVSAALALTGCSATVFERTASNQKITYAPHVQNIGWAAESSDGDMAGSVGQGLRLEALRFSTATQTARAHVQNVGWQGWRMGADAIGTEGQSLRIEALEVKSTVAGQRVMCQAHVQNIGWMPAVSGGQTCGTTGRSLRLEAVRLWVELDSTPTPTPTVTPDPTVTPTPPPVPNTGAFLFGEGSQANGMGDRLVQETGLQLISTWFNFRSDLGFYDVYRTEVTPKVYAAGKAMHLITWHAQSTPTTDGRKWIDHPKYGRICGAEYPMSPEFLTDMARLARNVGGSADGPPLYVSLFTEFTTYACPDGIGGISDSTRPYYTALKDVYRQTKAIFKANAPNAKVAINWMGSEITWGDPGRMTGKYQIPWFADIMNESDFQSTQAMSNVENVEQTIAMAIELHKYGNGKVLQAHYKVDNSGMTVFDQDMAKLFTDDSIRRLKEAGVFGWSFLDAAELINGNETRYQRIKNGIIKYQIKAPAWPLRTTDG